MQAAQLKEDWTAPLISDIRVGEKCDDSFEVLFEHLWPGNVKKATKTRSGPPPGLGLAPKPHKTTRIAIEMI